MRLPCDGVVTRGFSTDHPAVDMAYVGGGEASYGKPLYAPMSGKVTHVGQKGQVGSIYDAGTVVEITATPDVIRVCHMIPGSPTVSVGQQVTEGQLIGKMGWSGYVIPANKEGTHTHVVMERNGVRVDIQKYVTTKGGADMQPITPTEVNNLLGLMWGVQTDPNGEGYNAVDRANDHKNLDGKPFYEAFNVIYQDPRTFEYADRVYKALHNTNKDEFEPVPYPVFKRK